MQFQFHTPVRGAFQTRKTGFRSTSWLRRLVITDRNKTVLKHNQTSRLQSFQFINKTFCEFLFDYIQDKSSRAALASSLPATTSAGGSSAAAEQAIDLSINVLTSILNVLVMPPDFGNILKPPDEALIRWQQDFDKRNSQIISELIVKNYPIGLRFTDLFEVDVEQLELLFHGLHSSTWRQ